MVRIVRVVRIPLVLVRIQISCRFHLSSDLQSDLVTASSINKAGADSVGYCADLNQQM